MSIDGPGAPDRFGVWRLWDLSGYPTITPVAARLISLSDNAMARMTGVDTVVGVPTGYTDLSQLYEYVPKDIGVPESLASFGVAAAYIANTLNIGLEVIVPSQMGSRPLVDEQVQALFHGTSDPNKSVPIRAVDTLNDPDPSQALVVGVEQGVAGVNKLVLSDG